MILIAAIVAGIVVFTADNDNGAKTPADEAPFVAQSATATVAHIAGTTGKEFLLYTVDQLKVLRRMTLREARPTAKRPGVEFLEARLLTIIDKSKGSGFAGNPAGLCSDTYPPPGYGPTESIDGQVFEKGDVVALLFYIRGDPEHPGDVSFSGVEISYEERGRSHVTVAEGNEFRLSVRRSAGDYPSGRMACQPQPSIWFGTA